MLILFFSFEFLSKRSYRLYPITIQLKIQAKYYASFSLQKYLDLNYAVKEPTKSLSE